MLPFLPRLLFLLSSPNLGDSSDSRSLLSLKDLRLSQRLLFLLFLWFKISLTFFFSKKYMYRVLDSCDTVCRIGGELPFHYAAGPRLFFIIKVEHDIKNFLVFETNYILINAVIVRQHWLIIFKAFTLVYGNTLYKRAVLWGWFKYHSIIVWRLNIHSVINANLNYYSCEISKGHK